MGNEVAESTAWYRVSAAPEAPSKRGARRGVGEKQLEIQIGSKLKELYSEVVNQPVPDRLLELLRQLEEGDAKVKR